MIDYDVKVEVDCEYCTKKIDLDKDELIICHEKCEQESSIDYMIDTMRDVLVNYPVWENHEGYIAGNTPEEKEWYMRGIKEGMFSAFFWYANMKGDEGIKEFETLYELFGRKLNARNDQ